MEGKWESKSVIQENYNLAETIDINTKVKVECDNSQGRDIAVVPWESRGKAGFSWED